MENYSALDTDAHKDERIGMMRMIIEDIRCALNRDPAARNWFEVLTNYAGLHAIWFFRLTHWLWMHKILFLARWISQITRFFTGVEIHPGAVIGRRFFIDHGMGVVIGETSEIGDDVTMYHGVTLGGVDLKKGKRHPTLGNKVVVGAGAKILGDIEIGDGSRIGANAVVVRRVPSEAVVVGVPGQVIKRSEKRVRNLPDLHHDQLPDTFGMALRDVMHRLDYIEKSIHVQESKHIQTDEDGCWIGLDFSI